MRMMKCRYVSVFEESTRYQLYVLSCFVYCATLCVEDLGVLSWLDVTQGVLMQ